MPSSLEREIREHVLAYLEDRATLVELKDWLVSVIWDCEDPDHPAAPELAYEAFMALADHSSDLTTESEVRDALYGIVRVAQTAQ